MKSACQALRQALADPRLTDGAWEAHLADCADCAAFAARLGRAVGALEGLERRGAPPELDGLVVAALQAGARQDRAVRALVDLSPEPAPEHVDEALAARLEFEAALDSEVALDPESGSASPEFVPPRLKAPQVLERLVGEELADPAASRARRFVGGLPRLEAPEALTERVALHMDQLALAPVSLSGQRGSGSGMSLGFGKLVALVAASVILVGLAGPLGSLWPRPSGPAPQARSLSLQQASLADLASFSSMGRDMVDGLGGGLATARERLQPGEAR